MPSQRAAAEAEAEVVATDLVVPISGEVVSLADAPACARALQELATLEVKLREAKRLLRDALIAESQRQGRKTLHLEGGLVARITTKKNIVWDLEELEKLRDLGLPENRFNELVQETVSYKVDARVANQLAGANDQYRQVLERAREDTISDGVEVSRR